MIAEERLRGRIDQIDKVRWALFLFLFLLIGLVWQVIYFETDSSLLNIWDKHIQTCCDAVNAITDQIAVKYPEYVWMQ